jgi:hypothetical protein
MQGIGASEEYLIEKIPVVGRVMRMTEGSVTKIAMKGYIEGRRAIGRPRGRWLDAVDRDVEMQELEKVGRG